MSSGGDGGSGSEVYNTWSPMGVIKETFSKDPGMRAESRLMQGNDAANSSSAGNGNNNNNNSNSSVLEASAS